jgi:hypothetical protein
MFSRKIRIDMAIDTAVGKGNIPTFLRIVTITTEFIIKGIF